MASLRRTLAAAIAALVVATTSSNGMELPPFGTNHSQFSLPDFQPPNSDEQMPRWSDFHNTDFDHSPSFPEMPQFDTDDFRDADRYKDFDLHFDPPKVDVGSITGESNDDGGAYKDYLRHRMPIIVPVILFKLVCCGCCWRRRYRKWCNSNPRTVQIVTPDTERNILVETRNEDREGHCHQTPLSIGVLENTGTTIPLNWAPLPANSTAQPCNSNPPPFAAAPTPLDWASLKEDSAQPPFEPANSLPPSYEAAIALEMPSVHSALPPPYPGSVPPFVTSSPPPPAAIPPPPKSTPRHPSSVPPPPNSIPRPRSSAPPPSDPSRPDEPHHPLPIP